MMRQIVLDTETTGLETKDNHKIIEIGCVELVNRKLTGNHYHQYLQPDRIVDEAAIEVHGITNEFLQDKPRFEDIVEEFLAFIEGAELVIHNAAFDVGFINHELNLLNEKTARSYAKLENICTILDTLALAREKHPGQKNNLDALCKRYFVDNTQRDLHGALLDAEILADVYLIMTGGQTALSLGGDEEDAKHVDHEISITRLPSDRPVLKVVKANDEELQLHEIRLQKINKSSDGQCVWLGMNKES